MEKKIKKVITHKLLFKVIKKERLKRLRWFDLAYSNTTNAMNKLYIENFQNCSVCLVGGIMRQSSIMISLLNKNIDPSNNDVVQRMVVKSKLDPTEEENIARALRNKKYLLALSAKFESQDRAGVRERPDKKDKLELIEFVKKNIPKKFTVEI